MAEPPLPLILLLPDIYQRRPPPLQPRALSDSSGSMSAVPHAFKGDFDPEFIDQVKTQGWSLFPVCMVFIILRITSRTKRLGIRNLQVDDYLMVLAGAFYTTLIVTFNIICQGGGSNFYPPWTPENFTDQQIQERIFGSKTVLVNEQSMLNAVYTIKVCMLIMYRRLTLGLTAQKFVKYISWYVAAGYTTTQIAFFFNCRPFYNYWSMPAADYQCSTYSTYNIIQGCFNISSDVFILCVVVPLILRVNVPWRQKAFLLFVFSMGGFVIIAATLTKIFIFSNIWDPSYMLWYMREASVAIFVSNAPAIWPLLREWFPCLRSLTPSGGGDREPPRHGGAARRRGGSTWATTSSLWRRKLGLSTTTTTTTTTTTMSKSNTSRSNNNTTITTVTIGGSEANKGGGPAIPGGAGGSNVFGDGLMSFLRSARRGSIEDGTAVGAAPDDIEMGLGGGIYCGEPLTVEQQELQQQLQQELQQQQQRKKPHLLLQPRRRALSGSPAAGSSSERIIPPWMTTEPEPPAPDDDDAEQSPQSCCSSAAMPPLPPLMAPGTGVNVTRITALNKSPVVGGNGIGGDDADDAAAAAADKPNLAFPSASTTTHGMQPHGSSGGSGGSAIIHVTSTVEVRAEEMGGREAVVPPERVRRTWARKGVSRHNAAA